MSSDPDSEISYTLKVSPRVRHMRMSMHFDKGLVVTVPPHASHRHIKWFISTNTQWIVRKLKYMRSFVGKKFLKKSRKEYLQCKEMTRTLVKARLEHFNTQYHFTYGSVSIKNMTSRWGSCSRKGNLNFSYQLIHLPTYLADYIIVHELCHLVELNHSKRFWNLVAQTLPEYNKLKKELQENYVTLK